MYAKVDVWWQWRLCLAWRYWRLTTLALMFDGDDVSEWYGRSEYVLDFLIYIQTTNGFRLVINLKLSKRKAFISNSNNYLWTARKPLNLLGNCILHNNFICLSDQLLPSLYIILMQTRTSLKTPKRPLFDRWYCPYSYTHLSRGSSRALIDFV